MTWPFENDTSSAVKKLAKRSLKAGKNTVSVLAILLSALLFSGLFTVMGNVLAANEQSVMRTIGTYSHAGLKHATIEEYEELASDARWSGSGYSVFVGDAVGEPFLKLHTQVEAPDSFYAEKSFCLPETGRMPETEDEIATSRLVLNALGVPDTLGAQVPLTIETSTQTRTKTFTLCGFWQGDTVAGAQMAWVSRAYAEQVAPLRHGSSKDFPDNNCPTGAISAAFMLPGSWQLLDRAEEIFDSHGLAGELHYNYAYTSADLAAEDILTLLAAAGLVLAAGYLLIYNIFSISTAQEIRSYGLLKTIGATSRQLRKLVYRKALLLSAVGIPLGLLSGWLLGTALSPAIIKSAAIPGTVRVASADPAIFAGAAAFSLLTVFISCRKPASMAGRVSPMEALRYNEAAGPARASRRAGPVTPARLARQNLSRGRKKTAIVVLSLALSMVIFNSVSAVAGSFDFEAFISDSLVTDFCVGDAGVLNFYGASASRFSAVDGALQGSIAALEGLERMGNVYLSFCDQPITGELASIIRTAGQDEQVAKCRMYQEALAQMEAEAAEAAGQPAQPHTVGNMTYTLYGLDETTAGELKLLEGTLDWDKWAAGEGVFITKASLWNGCCLYRPGGRMSLDLTELIQGSAYDWAVKTGRTVKSYEVLAVVEVPGAFFAGISMGSGTGVILPAADYLSTACEERKLPMMTVFDVDGEHMAQAEAFLQNYTENVDPSMDYRSINVKREEFQNLIRMMSVVGGTVSALLGLIGLLNYVNSMTTSVLTRRRELAILQAVGMTGKQVRGMLVREGLCYAGLGITLAVLLSAGLNVTLLPALTMGMSAFTFRFTLTPVLLLVPPLLAAAWAVPLVCYRRLVKCRTVVERLRESE